MATTDAGSRPAANPRPARGRSERRARSRQDMDAAGAQGAAERVLAEVADVLEPTGLQEEAELPARILAEFVRNSRKKDKLLCSQLQVVGFLQSFLAQEDAAQALGPLASEDTSRQQALAAKEQWKELKSAYQEHVEALRCCLPQALPQLEEALDKCAELWEALQQLQAKKQVEEEKAREAQKQWRLQQETRLHSLAKASAEIRERQTGVQQKLAGLEQEIEALRQCAGREQGRLHRNQAYLKLLCALQGKPLAPPRPWPRSPRTGPSTEPLWDLRFHLDAPERMTELSTLLPHHDSDREPAADRRAYQWRPKGVPVALWP